jgi:uncharacterized membrane protein (UPF0182 family)
MAATRPGRPRLSILVVLAVLFLLLAASSAIATFYTDVLWFADLGHANVLWTIIASEWIVGIVFAAVFFALLYTNLIIARRMAPRAFLTVTGDMPQQLAQSLVQLKTTLEPVMRWVLLLGSLALAVAAGSSMAAHWQTFQLAAHATSFGAADPQFGRDVSFFVFTLPALRAVTDWLLSTLFLVLVLTAAIHVFDGAIRPWEKLRGFAPHVKAHLSVIAGLIVVTKAFDYWLQAFELDFSPRGQVLGASYTDVHAQLPALYILIAIAVVSGVILLVNIRFKGWRLPAIALGVWLAASILIGSVYPALVQNFRVAPNEVALEAPYISRNIASTRKAFGLDTVTTRPFAANADLTAADVAADRVTLDNIRLWDPVVMEKPYKQLQGIRPYYDFNDVDVDRYSVEGTRTEVLVGAREMNVSELADQAKTWVNQHLVYTHGYGVVVSPVNDVAPNGTPAFIVRDIPPTSTVDLKLTRSAIYYGETTTNYVVAATALNEFDYPKGDRNATTSYTGKTGVAVGGLLRRLAFALRFGSTDLLLSNYIKSDSKVLFDRSITQRVHRVAPWLELDRDPYIAIVDGKLVWILDGYTVSDHFPYSQRFGNGVNYIRNSVKATVDAYDGTLAFYAVDPKDPVLASWRKVFPGVVQDLGSMPQEVRVHLRYPEDLFLLQAEVYKDYHMLDPQVFYNKEDSWAIPGEGSGETMKPFYVLMRLPGEPEEDFLMMMPFTPRNKANMIGWMAAKSDPANYGQRLVYQFPKDKLTLGPEQVRARINQDPSISAQLSLWNQRGSSVLFGNLLVLPIKDAILYVQPLYLQAEQTAIPQLTRVIVAYGDRLSMEPDLATALARAFGFTPSGVSTTPPGSQPTTSAVPTPSIPTTVSPGVSSDLAAARDLFQRALAAQRRGDWAEYGRLIGQLGRVLDRLAAQSQATTGTAR